MSRAKIVALAIAQAIAWGVTWYSVPVLLGPIERALGIPRTTTSVAWTISMIGSAAFGLVVARALERWGGRVVTTCGAAFAVAVVVAWSQVRSAASLALVLVALGLAQAALLYEPIFAVLARHLDQDRRARDAAILTVTVGGGLASPIFTPLTAWLEARLGFRGALVTLAIVLASTIAVHAWAVPDGQGAPARSNTAREAPVITRPALGFALVAFATAGASLFLYPALVATGRDPADAAACAGAIGLAQIAGRLALGRLAPNADPARTTAIACALVAGSTIAIGLFDGPLVALLGFGVGAGLSTVARPMLLAEQVGPRAIARALATVALVSALARAAAPLVVTALSTRFGWTFAYAALGAIALLAILPILPSVTSSSVRVGGSLDPPADATIVNQR